LLLKSNLPGLLRNDDVINTSQRILRTDISATPVDWIGVEEAVKLYSQEQVAYPMGTPLCVMHGGTNAKSGLRSTVEVHSILCTQGHRKGRKSNPGYVPPLNNVTLFRRDANVCLYCGKIFANHDLSRDHITPISRGGQDIWTNVVTSCKRCNHFKGGRKPEEAGLELMAIPFTPNRAEYIYLSGRHILADQMEFLIAHFPHNSPLRQRA
jgi:5-methylcytosine-specific restriction endonuclease McrA